ncbi:DUF2617 family protein [Streptomyces sp. 3MP-14]|uniref:DUF2617 family protein n=1 Tax=Streptomyces mimosae TaxID=2586635 RepID=A0A5N6A277_9ACTN|nr:MULTISPECIES: DUF2617 family protein [Streptomyces]KAB8161770.1 DUF2617 family protein [Streptomyces mimosae]KAB8174962.1 DUF2617 family protein [Streptomyces sp. 3MP-14]
MLTTINTTFTDTRAGDLTWSLERGPQPALATLDLELADTSVQLRVLGASHQVLLNGSRGGCAETVACLAGDNSPLPLGVSRRLGDYDYEFAAHVETLSAGSFAGRAQELLALVAEHPHGLAALFPGDPNAFTALLAQRQGGQVHWRTWHSYPQERRLVATRTRVVGALRAVETTGKSTPVGDRASSRCDVTFGS